MNRETLASGAQQLQIVVFLSKIYGGSDEHPLLAPANPKSGFCGFSLSVHCLAPNIELELKNRCLKPTDGSPS